MSASWGKQDLYVLFIGSIGIWLLPNIINTYTLTVLLSTGCSA